jgi:anti-sigma factor RsiW
MMDRQSCQDFRKLIHGYADGELGVSEAVDLERHLATCAACAQELRNIQKLRSALKSPSLYYEMPKGLEQKIRSTIRKEQKSSQSLWSRFLTLQKTAALVAAAIIAAFSFELGSNLHSNLGRFGAHGVAQEVISEHVRSLQAQHLLDVVSSDQHTVKPWFTGKLDFSPKVKDLKEQEYPLIGGRLDYLSGHTVAAIVYRRHGHVINLFTWPEQRENQSLRSESHQGFNLIQWSENGMQYWVIPDLNSAELQQFVSLYRS